METAKIFENGRSQAVRLPKQFRFRTNEVVIQQLGEAVILVPKEALWKTFLGTEGTKALWRNESRYDLYVGYQYLYLYHEK